MDCIGGEKKKEIQMIMTDKRLFESSCCSAHVLTLKIESHKLNMWLVYIP